MLAYWRRGKVYLIMDNLSAHKKALRELTERQRARIEPYWLPTNSSWLNLIESYFAALQRVALHNTDYQTPTEIADGLAAGITYLNANPKPYVWKKI